MFTIGPSFWDDTPGTAWNQFDKGTDVVLSNSNRDATGAVSVRAIASAATGKKYYEIKFISTSGPNIPRVGVMDSTHPLNDRPGSTIYGVSYSHNGAAGLIFTNGSLLFGGSVPTFTAGDVIGIAIDIDAGKLWFSKNNTWVNDQGGTAGDPANGNNQRASPTTGKTYHPAISAEGWLLRGNFATSDFAYTPPTGFVAW